MFRGEFSAGVSHRPSHFWRPASRGLVCQLGRRKEVSNRVARPVRLLKSFRSKRELRQWVGRIQQVYNAAFAQRIEYCPVTEEEDRAIGERLLAIADPRLVKLVMKGEEMVGFLFAFPDISAAIQRTRGRLWPFGWVTLLREFKCTDWVAVNGVGLVPGHRGVAPTPCSTPRWPGASTSSTLPTPTWCRWKRSTPRAWAT